MVSLDIKKYRNPRDCAELGMMGCVWFVIGTGLFSVFFGVFVYHGYFKSFKGIIVALIYFFFVYNLAKAYFIVMYTDTYADKNWVPPNATKDELDEAIKNAPKLEEDFKTDKYARSLVPNLNILSLSSLSATHNSHRNACVCIRLFVYAYLSNLLFYFACLESLRKYQVVHKM